MSSTSKPFSDSFIWISRVWSAEDQGSLKYEQALNEWEREQANVKQALYGFSKLGFETRLYMDTETGEIDFGPVERLGWVVRKMFVDFWTE